MRKYSGVLAGAATLGLLSLPLTALPVQADAPAGTKVQLLNITDFHGRIAEAGHGVASVIEEERAKAKDRGIPTMALSAGDNIGASTYASSSQKDEPTLSVLDTIGLDASAVGNHEFDRGYADLRDRVDSSANFPYLGANVYKKGTKDVADGLEPYKLIDLVNPAGGKPIRVAVIGAVTRDTANMVSPAGISDIEFGDVTDAVNTAAKDLEALPAGEKPDVTVVEAHTGPSETEDLDSAKASNAEFRKLMDDADDSVDAFFIGHTHLPVDLRNGDRPVIQAKKYGEAVGQAVLESTGDGSWKIDSQGLIDAVDSEGKQHDYDSEVVGKVDDIVDRAVTKSKEIGSEVAGTIDADITRAFKNGSEDRGGESTLGNLVADALDEGTADSPLKDSDFAITNPGGLRTDLKVDDIFNKEAPGEVTVAELNQVLPFANDHGVVTMKGKDVKGLFEEQWQPDGASRPFLHLGISKQLHVVYDSKAKSGEHVKQVLVNGKPIKDDKEYRVATLSFLAAGGDNFTSFTKGGFEQSGLTDFDVWQTYFEKRAEKKQQISPDKHERQADNALSVLDSGDLKVALGLPDGATDIRVERGGSANAALHLQAQKDIKGPFTLQLNLPKGVTATIDDDAAKKSLTADDSALRVAQIPEGKTDVPVTLHAADDAQTGQQTVTGRFQADPAAAWWDDNPLPLPTSGKVEVSVVDAAGAGPSSSPSSSPSEKPTQPGSEPTDGSGDEPSAQPSATSAPGGSADADGNGGNDDGSNDDAGDLPMTGAQIGLAAGAGAVLLAVGAAAVVIGRRKATRH
jgi:5'-nucleotidase